MARPAPARGPRCPRDALPLPFPPRAARVVPHGAAVAALRASGAAVSAPATAVDHDHQIRALLLPQLRARAEWVCEEFCCDGRVDLATIEGGLLCGYEIKGARDTLKRLFPTHHELSQVAMYSHMLDRVTVVCAANHVAACVDRLPAWWGVTVAADGALAVVREGQQNPADTTPRLGWAMWTSEARDLLREHDMLRGARTRADLANRMAALPPRVVRAAALDALKRRVWGPARKRKPTLHASSSATPEVDAFAAPAHNPGALVVPTGGGQ